MKKLTALLLSCFLLFNSFSPLISAETVTGAVSSAGPPEIQTVMTPVEPLTCNFLPAGTRWRNFTAGEKPAAFENYSLQLADNVVQVDSAVTAKIATAGQLLSGADRSLSPKNVVDQGGYIPKGTLDAAFAQQDLTVQNGSVVVDPSSGTAFKIVSPTAYSGIFMADADLNSSIQPLAGSYAVTKPALSEVIKEFTLTEDTVTLTRGNITGFAPNIEKNLVLPGQSSLTAYHDSMTGFKTLSADPLIELQFAEEKLDAKLGDGSSISVTVSGGLGIDQVDLTGSYSGFKGYRVAMTLKQESYLKVELNASVSQEIRIPILGITVPFGIGSISGGIFAIVGMDGTLRLEIESRESTATTLGVRGSTKFYVPTSVHPIFEQEFRSDGDVDLSGDIDGYLKFGPMLSVEIFGLDLVGAGVFLGAGVHVDSDGLTLNVELYGIFNVYADLAGKHFNLANYQPTILKRTQADTGGYRIKIQEAYILPGRVGGTIQKEPDMASGGTPAEPPTEADYIPAEGLQYRFLVVPENESFTPGNQADINQASVRKYPASGYALTNNEGEIFQEAADMLFKGDRVYLEFVGDNGKTYYSDPVTAVLPFSDIALTRADYFNDYATGQVQPIRVINWDADADDPPEEQYEWTYYANGLIYVGTANSGVSGGYKATTTDQYGNFDTRKPASVTGHVIPVVTNTPYFDIKPTYKPETDFSWHFTDFTLSIDYNNATLTKRVFNFQPTMELGLVRTVEAVAGSHRRFSEGNRIVDEMTYVEYIWIENPDGTRTVTADEFDYSMWAFSTQDFYYRSDDQEMAAALAGLTGENKWSDPPIVQAKPDTEILTPVLDENGNPTGSALYSQQVTVQWVWQEHPNPVTITSGDHTTAGAAGGEFAVTATGFAPFAYSLDGAPPGVAINPSTGRMAFPANLAPGEYTFTIKVREDEVLILTPPGQYYDDPRQGNDPSEPAEQAFTLTVAADEPTTGPTEPEPTGTAEPTGAARTPPVIGPASHGYDFAMVSGGSSLEIPIQASGSAPITYALRQTGRYILPAAAAINAQTGLLSVSGSIEPGTYYFTILAENDVGSDTQECRLVVAAPAAPPVLGDEWLADGVYTFTKLVNGGDLTRTITAAGSEPITFSLLPTGRYPLPPEVAIDPATGVLTIHNEIAAGTYYFTIKAENAVGSDTQACVLKVVSLHLGSAGGYTLLAVRPGDSAPEKPANSVLIRCDHALDVYTDDRKTVDGSQYIRWDSAIKVSVDGESIAFTLLDEAPVSENYHYVKGIVIPDSTRDKIKGFFAAQVTDYQKGALFDGGILDNNGLLGEFRQLTVNPLADSIAFLDYGQLLAKMQAAPGDSFAVDLDAAAGTMVAGRLLAGLKDSGAALVFRQPGAQVSFAGQDIGAVSAYDLYNFAYTPKSAYASEMLAAAGSGGENFTYAFAYHGDLPGLATFAIETGMRAGTRVNVYRYDQASASFTLIARNLAVGAQGLVTYQNNTMSEYLITSKTLPGAAVSAAASLAANNPAGMSWLTVILAAAGLLALALAAVLYFRRRAQAGAAARDLP